MNSRIAIALSVSVLTTIALLGGPAYALPTDVSAPAPDRFDGRLRQVALGVSMYSGRNLAELDDFQASIDGQPVALWTTWTNWGTPTLKQFPTTAATAAHDRGAVPVIWWEPINQGWERDGVDTKYSSHQNIINGVHDGYIREFALDAKRYQHRVLLRFAMQANSDTLPWGWDYSKTDDNTVDSFIAAWRHVRGLFRDVGASNVKFVWSVATQTCAGDCLSRPLGYPGDNYVDYSGFTWENWGEANPDSVVPSRPSISMLDGFTPIVRKLSSVSGKPIIAAAIASGPDGGTKAQWIRTGYPAVYKNLKQVVAISWLNEDLSDCCHYHRDWSLSGAALDAYAEIAAMPEFQGRIR